MSQLLGEELTLAYQGTGSITRDLNIEIEDGKITGIIGPNGCGKSTVLRALSRLLKPQRGTVILDGQAIHSLPTIEVARRLCILPQQPTAPEAITVEDLVLRGRYPHQSFMQPPCDSDMEAVEQALAVTGTLEFRGRAVDELSGGQRQRVWIAMALAQETGILLLDEPTTYLDVAHQLDILQLVQQLNRSRQSTIVMVLHDINNAAQFCDRIIAMRDGEIVAEGDSEQVLAPALLHDVFGVHCDIVSSLGSGTQTVVPRSGVPFGVSVGMFARATPVISTRRLDLSYETRRVVHDVSLSIPAGSITAIVGPNGCGKSTLLRSLAHLLNPVSGSISLNGQPIAAMPHARLARELTMLSQGATVPAGISVEELVAIGRYPYQRWFRQWSKADQAALDRALEATDIKDFRWRAVDTLSGGQRQRVWLATALAQDTPTLLVDEPTTFLDIALQIDVLDLVWDLNRKEGRTVVMVVHDLVHACRYADHLIVMKDGRIVETGPPSEVVRPELVQYVFGIRSELVGDPATGKPLIIPIVPGVDEQVVPETAIRARHRLRRLQANEV